MAEWQRCFYTTAEPDPDSESDSYDPTWECFNIVDGAVASNDDTEDDGKAGAAAAAPAAGGNPELPNKRGGRTHPFPRKTRLHNSHNYES